MLDYMRLYRSRLFDLHSVEVQTDPIFSGTQDEHVLGTQCSTQREQVQSRPGAWFIYRSTNEAKSDNNPKHVLDLQFRELTRGAVTFAKADADKQQIAQTLGKRKTEILAEFGKRMKETTDNEKIEAICEDALVEFQAAVIKVCQNVSGQEE